MSWFIQQDVNNGYPALYEWRAEWETGWTANDNIRYPDLTFRIKSGVNNNYPWIYPWFKENSSAEGEMMIGGSRTNYPNGFTDADRGSIRDTFDDNPMYGGSWGGGLADNALTEALANRAFAINSTTLNAVLAAFNTNASFDATYISLMYGANIFDSVLSCKVFPFDLAALNSISEFWTPHSIISSATGTIKAFGKYDLGITGNLLGGSAGEYWFPSIWVTPSQAWEIENIDFSIYLPMSGIYPIDIRGESEVKVMMNVDLIEGAGEYYVYINGQLVGTYRAMFGADVPVNTNQGRMAANMLTNVISTFGKAAGTLAGAALGGVGGSVIGQAIGGSLPTEHYAMNTPSVGGIVSFNSYGNVRVIAKVPKMFRRGNGYEETLGANRSAAYTMISDCSGYIQCKNYKTDIIVATDTEKAEIEKLMNEGVFI
jgi:hypothetical protein